jgi:hypothetical protein
MAQFQTSQGEKAKSDLAAYFTIAAPNSVDVNGIPVYDWKIDPEASRLMAASGMDMATEAGNVDQIYRTATMTTEQRGNQAMRQSSWYQGLNDSQRAEAESKLIPYMNKLALFGAGYEPTWDETTKQFIIKDTTTGEVISGTQTPVYNNPEVSTLAGLGAGPDLAGWMDTSSGGKAFLTNAPSTLFATPDAIAQTQLHLPVIQKIYNETSPAKQLEIFNKASATDREYLLSSGAWQPVSVLGTAGSPVLKPAEIKTALSAWGSDLEAAPISWSNITEKAGYGESGNRRTKLTTAAYDWANSNKGKVVEYNGKLWIVQGPQSPKTGRGTVQQIMLMSVDNPGVLTTVGDSASGTSSVGRVLKNVGTAMNAGLALASGAPVTAGTITRLGTK